MTSKVGSTSTTAASGLAMDDYGNTPIGIRGYAILLLAFLAVTAFGYSFLLFIALQEIAEKWPVWPGSIKAIVVGILAPMFALAILGPPVLILLGLRRSETFPGLCIIWIWAVTAVGFIWFIATGMAPEGSFEGVGILGVLLGALAWLFLVLALIVSSYFDRSARAENTFTR